MSIENAGTSLSNENRLTPEKIKVLSNFFSDNDILLMGVTGAGKTTFVEHIQRSVGLRYISLGNITRAEIEYLHNGEIINLMHRGGVWSFETIVDLLKPYIEQPSPYVLDGIPKHEHEAEWLVGHTKKRPWSMTAIMLRVSMLTAEERRLKSLIASERPETVAQVRERIATFEGKEKILMEILNSSLKRVIEIDTNGLTPSATVNALAEKLLNY